MAQHIGVDRLGALLKQAASTGGTFAWLDPDLGLVLGDGFRKMRFFIDIGGERLVASGPEATPFSDGSAPPRHVGQSTPSAVWQDVRSGRRTGDFVLTLEGNRYAASSQKQLLLVGLQAIERARPGSLEKLSRERARTKRVVSRDRMALNRNPTLAEKFSERIEGDWWAFTNNSFAETEKFILRAAFHAGLHASVERLS